MVFLQKTEIVTMMHFNIPQLILFLLMLGSLEAIHMFQPFLDHSHALFQIIQMSLSEPTDLTINPIAQTLKQISENFLNPDSTGQSDLI